jgi:aminopeptidase C
MTNQRYAIYFEKYNKTVFFYNILLHTKKEQSDSYQIQTLPAKK